MNVIVCIELKCYGTCIVQIHLYDKDTLCNYSSSFWSKVYLTSVTSGAMRQDALYAIHLRDTSHPIIRNKNSGGSLGPDF